MPTLGYIGRMDVRERTVMDVRNSAVMIGAEEGVMTIREEISNNGEIIGHGNCS
jgi:hypothetical protein